ncbi:MAG: alpha/beta hydrolase [Oligoflexia bacterium]|nr:alpha/beta hydrolase [Oligoflexia bacterium]
MEIVKAQLKDGLHLTFKRHGSGTKIYLLLHGIPGSAHSWDRVATKLSGESSTVLVPDLLGFGLSARPSDISGLWLEAQAQALSEGLEQLGVDRFHLVGHDYGGPISVTLYKMIPGKVKSLTLLATNTFTDTPIPPPLVLIKAPIIGKLWGKAIFSKLSLRMMLKQGVGNKATSLDSDSALGDELQTRAIATIFDSALRELKYRYKAVEDSLPNIKIPTTVIWGTKDPFFSVNQGKRTASAIPGAKFIALDGAGHFLPEERPDEITFELKKLMLG